MPIDVMAFFNLICAHRKIFTRMLCTKVLVLFRFSNLTVVAYAFPPPLLLLALLLLFNKRDRGKTKLKRMAYLINQEQNNQRAVIMGLE